MNEAEGELKNYVDRQKRITTSETDNIVDHKNSRYKGIFSLADILEIAIAYPSSCIFAVLAMF